MEETRGQTQAVLAWEIEEEKFPCWSQMLYPLCRKVTLHVSRGPGIGRLSTARDNLLM